MYSVNNINRTYHILGLMSGSSLDGLDLAFAKFDISYDADLTTKTKDALLNSVKIKWELLASETLEYSEKWIPRLAELPQQSGLIVMKTHTYFGHYMGELVNKFLVEKNITPDFIASHGHTLYHFPNERVTTQIGDGAALAAITGYPVVSDFRTSDVAMNGEGTPLAPIADRLLFEGYDFYLNLGGIANISCNIDGRFVAFDVGTANQSFNYLAQLTGHKYDNLGMMGASGTKNEPLFDELNEDAYFQKLYPKSLDNSWIKQNIFSIYDKNEATVEDKLRTSYEHLAYQIANSISKIIKKEKLDKRNYSMLISGGGAFNSFLVKLIEKYCNKICNCEVVIPSPETIKYKEALLMGLMGLLRVENIPNCMKSVTGAMHDTIGGAIYQGYKSMIR